MYCTSQQYGSRLEKILDENLEIISSNVFDSL